MVKECKTIIRNRVTISNSNGRAREAMTMLLLAVLTEPGDRKSVV